jgi:hypothetical protein
MNTCTNAGQAPARTAAPMSVVENQVDGRPRPDERTTKYCELWPKFASRHPIVVYLVDEIHKSS